MSEEPVRTFAKNAEVFSEKEWKRLVEELSLSPRQGEIVHHLFTGKSDKQIAQEMKVAIPTIRTHMGRLFTKFDIHDRTELIVYVFQRFRTADSIPQQ